MSTDPRHARNRELVRLGLLACHRERDEPVSVCTLEVRLRMNADSVRTRLNELKREGHAWQPRFGRWLPGREPA